MSLSGLGRTSNDGKGYTKITEAPSFSKNQVVAILRLSAEFRAHFNQKLQIRSDLWIYGHLNGF